MNELVFFLNKGVLAGAVIGSIYAMGAIGATLLFAILRFAHFAHADLMTLGAFIAFALTLAWPEIGAPLGLPTAFVMMPAAVLLTALAAILIDQAVYKPLRDRGAPSIVFVMASIGVTLMLQGAIRLIAGTGARSMYVAERKEIHRLPLGEGARANLVITEAQILLLGTVAAALAALHLFLTRAKLGKAMRAMADNPDLARVSGVSTRRVVWAAWAIGAGLAAAAGVLLALDVALKPDLSFNILLPIFAAAIVGGVGDPRGAVVGGYLVGYAETLGVFNWAVLLRPLERLAPEWIEAPAKLALAPTEYKLIIPFLLLIAVLIWRPNGLFRDPRA